jgi:hypothetical protein
MIVVAATHLFYNLLKWKHFDPWDIHLMLTFRQHSNFKKAPSPPAYSSRFPTLWEITILRLVYSKGMQMHFMLPMNFAMIKTTTARAPKTSNRVCKKVYVTRWTLYRTSGVIFFIDYCTAIRDT